MSAIPPEIKIALVVIDSPDSDARCIDLASVTPINDNIFIIKTIDALPKIKNEVGCGFTRTEMKAIANKVAKL